MSSSDHHANQMAPLSTLKSSGAGILSVYSCTRNKCCVTSRRAGSVGRVSYNMYACI